MKFRELKNIYSEELDVLKKLHKHQGLIRILMLY